MSAKKKCETIDVYDVIRPFYYVAKIFGFAPFVLDRKSAAQREGRGHKCFFTDFKNVVYMLPFSVICLYVIVEEFWVLWQNDFELNDFHGLLVRLVAAALCMVTIVLQFKFRTKTVQILRRIDETDHGLNLLGTTIPYKKHRSVLYYQMGTYFVFQGFTVACSIHSLWRRQNGTYFWMHAIVIVINYGCIVGAFSVLLMQYISGLYAVQSRFSAINRCIKKYFFGFTDDKFLMDGSIHRVDVIAIKLARLHDSILDILELVNQSFSFQAMMTMTVCFIYNIFCWFEFYRNSRTHVDDSHYFMVINISRILYCIGSVTHVSYAGSYMTKEGKYTAVLLHKILNSIQQHKGLEKRIRCFAQQVHSRPPLATCGLFAFDWTLIFSIIGAFATYLIILIQFDTASSSVRKGCVCLNNRLNYHNLSSEISIAFNN